MPEKTLAMPELILHVGIDVGRVGRRRMSGVEREIGGRGIGSRGVILGKRYLDEITEIVLLKRGEVVLRVPESTEGTRDGAFGSA
jgi:hypothetical protein